jgi:hypothetical protein
MKIYKNKYNHQYELIIDDNFIPNSSISDNKSLNKFIPSIKEGSLPKKFKL